MLEQRNKQNWCEFLRVCFPLIGEFRSEQKHVQMLSENNTITMPKEMINF